MSYLCKNCKARRKGPRQPLSLVSMVGGFRRGAQMTPAQKMGAKWLAKVRKVRPGPKDNVSLAHMSPMGGRTMFGSATRIEAVVDWAPVRRKYRQQKISYTEKSAIGNKEQKEDEAESTMTPSKKMLSIMQADASLKVLAS